MSQATLREQKASASVMYVKPADDAAENKIQHANGMDG
jgi:hypothetical protein